MYFTLQFRSSDIRPSFADIHELRAFVRPGVPMLAATARVTKEMREDVMQVRVCIPEQAKHHVQCVSANHS